MQTYAYKARNRLGEPVSGKMEGANEVDIAAKLDGLGYSISNITSDAKLSSSLTALTGQFKQIKKQEVIIFTRQLATLVRAGMPLSPALATICDQTVNKKLKAVLEDVQQVVQGGVSFSEALSKYPNIFPELFISMVEVGETAGILDKVLDRLTVLGTTEMETQSRIKSALLYPITLVVIAFLVINFLVIGVLPKFVVIFRASEANLPLPTQIILGISWIMRKLWLFILVGLGMLAVWFKKYTSTTGGKLKFHSFLLALPIFGQLYTKIQVSRFARTLSALTSSGIPILQGLEVVEKTLTNAVIRKAIKDIRTSITHGRPLVESFKQSGVFTPMVIQMISTGEKTGTLDQMLEEISSFYDPEIEYTVKNLTTILEPLMLLVMGFMVAFIALSVLMPIFNLIKVYRG